MGEDNKAYVYLQISEEQYEKLAVFDEVYVYYVEDGAIVERIPATLSKEGDEEMWFYAVEFETTHFSAYALAGENVEEPVVPKAPNTGVGR